VPVHRPIRSRRSRLVAVVASVALVLTGCTSVVNGTLGAHSVPDAHLPVKGVTNSSFDTFAQNALSDIEAFWRANYPKISGGKALPPIKGGYYSVDGRAVAVSGKATAPATQNACIAQENDAIVDNAFYCRSDDSIAWDRSPTHLLGKLSAKYGRLLVGLIFAHEFGHAISNRLGVFDNDPATIYTESQADCAAGAWAASALKNQDPHFTDTTVAKLDEAFEGYLNSRDSTPDTPQDISHGNGFDRLSALADGLDKGVTYCYSSGYFQSRHFTERPFASQDDYDAGGNQPLSDVIDTSSSNLFVQDLNRYWTAEAKTSSGNTTFDAVKIAEADHPPCAATTVKFGYCADNNTVYFDTDFAKSAYYSLSQIGADKQTGDIVIQDNQPADFALGVLFAIAWGMAVRHQLFNRSLDGKDALLAAVCYSGSYAKDINIASDPSQTRKIILSPADLDEAVSAMLKQAGEPAAFGADDTSGLDRIQSFVKGYNGGLAVC